MQGSKPIPAAYDDGVVEIYGLTAGALAHGWNVRTVESHTRSLGRGHGIRLYVHSSDTTEHKVYTLMDGEDWWQRVPPARAGASVRDGILVCLKRTVMCIALVCTQQPATVLVSITMMDTTPDISQVGSCGCVLCSV